uniref:Multidrug and toxic compound extrusion protein n=1 Tax=Rhodosorus marinus TaxID=101924 RepID=A0A7S0G2Z8_9RHOD
MGKLTTNFGFINGVSTCQKTGVAGRRGTACCMQKESAAERRDRDARIAKLAIPAMGALLVEPVLGMVDTAFVGQIGTNQLAGVGIASFIMKGTTTLFSFFLPISTAMFAGEADKENQKKLLRSAVGMAFVIGIFGGLVLYSTAGQATSLMAGVSSAASVPYAVSYIGIRSLALPFMVATLIFSGMLRALQDTVTIFKAALASNLLNALLDYVMIFWLYWGVCGAALATTISQVVQSIILGTVVARRGYWKLTDMRLSDVLNITVLREFVGGSVLLLRTASNIFTFMMAGKLAATIGTAQVAAFEVAKQVWSFQVLVTASLHLTTTSVIGKLVSEGNENEARKFGDRCVEFGLYLGIIHTLTVVAFGNWIPTVFTNDPQVIRLGAECLKMSAWAQPATACAFVLEGCFLSLKKYRTMTFNNIIAAVISWIPLGLALYTNSTNMSITFLGINVLLVSRFAIYFLHYFSRKNPLIPYKEEARQPRVVQGGEA